MHVLNVNETPPVCIKAATSYSGQLSESCCLREFNIIILICTLIENSTAREKSIRTLNYLEKSQFATGSVNFACLAIAQKFPLGI